MTHLPYEDWLFEPPDGGLSQQQTAELQAHLLECSDCRLLAGGWRQVERGLRLAGEVAPTPGFAGRWQARLEENRRRAHQRQTRLAVGFSLGGTLVLLAALAALAWPWLRTPGLLLWTWIYQLWTVYTLADNAGQALLPLARSAAGVAPLLAWLLLAGIASQLAVLWAVSYRMLTNPRRITK